MPTGLAGQAAAETMIAVVAALPRELLGLSKELGTGAPVSAGGLWRAEAPHVVLVTAGMGAARVAVAVQAALAAGGVELLVSAGLAGSCEARMEPGFVAEATEVVDTLTGERYKTDVKVGSLVDPRYGTRTDIAKGIVLATSAEIATVAEKTRLSQSYGASLVDMEAATVARLARAHGVRFRAVKGISDGPEFELGGLGKFAGKQGEFLTIQFALHTMLRPATWGKAIELGKWSNLALTGLRGRLRQLLVEESVR
jgi:adenosylhomocysteine nucleosidase